MRLLKAARGAARASGLLAGLSGCFPGSPDLPDARRLTGVRVLGSVSSPASGVPGARLELGLEVFDGAQLVDEARRASAPGDENVQAAQEPPSVPLHVAWLGGCHNPPGDLQSGCYPLLQEIAARLPDPLPESGAGLPPEQAAFFGLGPRFALRIPADILEARQLRTAAAPFGVSFSFFAVCRGVLRPEPGAAGGVPLSCHDPESGERLGSDAFVVGFVTTYTYAGDINRAPGLLGASLDGEASPSGECESDADCEGPSALACERPLAPEFSAAVQPPARRCLPRVSPCAAPPCASFELSPWLAPDAVEPDRAAASPGRPPPDEILWVKYFGFGGFSRSEALINDRATGLSPDYALRWSPPPFSLESPLPVWAVVQDNRGGTSIARWDFVVRE